MHELAERLTMSCRAVDPASTDEIIEQARDADVIGAQEVKPPAGG